MKPRIGALGVGWIGSQRLASVHASGAVEISCLADASPEVARSVAEAYGATVVAPDELIDEADLDGVIVATPSALHADQVSRALGRGLSVLCQKPLALTAPAAEELIAYARGADLLLGVDMSYRRTAAVEAIAEVLRAGTIGDVYAAELVFHNAYGPDKAWFRNPALSGGGCVTDLGIHLVDLAGLFLDWPKIEAVTSRLFASGVPLSGSTHEVEDYAVARLDFSNGSTATLSCSWNLDAGVDAVIAVRLYGTSGSVAFENVGGSFYDFAAFVRHGTSEEQIAAPPDDWGGRVGVDWAFKLAAGGGFDPAVERVADVARILDRIYNR